MDQRGRKTSGWWVRDGHRDREVAKWQQEGRDPGLVVCVFNPSTREAEAGGSL